MDNKLMAWLNQNQKVFSRWMDKNKDRALKIAGSTQRLTRLLSQVNHKLTRSKEELNDLSNEYQLAKPFNGIKEAIVDFYSLLIDWKDKRYTDLPISTVVMVVLGLLYFVTPFDAIADFIPFSGFLDDAFVLNIVINRVNNDLDKYRLWRQSTENIKEIDITLDPNE